MTASLRWHLSLSSCNFSTEKCKPIAHPVKFDRFLEVVKYQTAFGGQGLRVFRRHQKDRRSDINRHSDITFRPSDDKR